jgi:hypothetical protein
MIKRRGNRTLANEKKYPNIVELSVPQDGLEIGLSRRIIEFHKSRQIRPRHGRQIAKGKSRWCFADLGTACDFIDQFGGALCETGL